MHIRHGDFRRQFCTNPIRCSMEAGEPSTRRSPQVRFYRTLPNNVSLSQKPRDFASSRCASTAASRSMRSM